MMSYELEFDPRALQEWRKLDFVFVHIPYPRALLALRGTAADVGVP